MNDLDLQDWEHAALHHQQLLEEEQQQERDIKAAEENVLYLLRASTWRLLTRAESEFVINHVKAIA